MKQHEAKDSPLTIKNKLKEIRKQRGMSQEELADAFGVSRQSIIALEQGKHFPSLPLIANMCQFFNSAFEDIFEFEFCMKEELGQIINNDSNIGIKIINKPGVNLETGIFNKQRARKEANMPFELEPWRPFREAVSLRDAMDRLFEESVVSPTKSVVAMPKIDIKEKKDSVVVNAELPGVAEEDIEVEITENVMTISGEKKEEKETEKEGYYYKESHSGLFTRSFSLPSEVAAEKAEANVKDGVLTITIPKVEAKKPKKVTIKKKK